MTYFHFSKTNFEVTESIRMLTAVITATVYGAFKSPQLSRHSKFTANGTTKVVTNQFRAEQNMSGN